MCVCFLLFTATREAAFIHAISTAAIIHEIILQCRLNRIPGCGCAQVKKQREGTETGSGAGVVTISCLARKKRDVLSTNWK